MTKKKEFKLDMFELLSALDRRDFKFYSNLTDEQKKAFAGIVAMRWMSVIPDRNQELCEFYIQMVNGAANKHFWNSEMQKHPELQYLVLAVSGIGTKQRHEWIKGPAKKNKNKTLKLLSEYYPTANDEELLMFYDMNDMDEIIQIAKMLGHQDSQIKELKKELKGLGK